MRKHIEASKYVAMTSPTTPKKRKSETLGEHDSSGLDLVHHGPSESLPQVLAVSTSSQSPCPKCASVNFSQVKPNPCEWTRSALKLGTLSDIISEPDCPLCQLFSSMASRTQPGDSQSLSTVFYLCSFYTSAMYGT